MSVRHTNRVKITVIQLDRSGCFEAKYKALHDKKIPGIHHANRRA